MANRLAEIIARKREEVAAARRAVLPDPVPGAPRGFRRALEAKIAAGRPALIAEIKKASPSKGLIRADFDSAAHARDYETGGAACLSVLTDEPFFQGHRRYLEQARAACALPVLRKEFMVDPWQVSEARSMGADAILLIVAALDDGCLAEIEAAAIEQGLDVLVEVHDRPELDRAARLRSRLIGVNNRDLRDFSVDPTRAWTLAAQAPTDCLLVSESGIAGADDVRAAQAHGINAFLVGESLMRAGDVEAATRRLLAAA